MKHANTSHPQGSHLHDGGYDKDGMHKTSSSKGVLTKPGKMRKRGGGKKNFAKA